MLTKMYIVPGPWTGQLAISSRPRGGDWLDDEVRAWRKAGVNIVVSLLEPQEEAELELEKEQAACRHAGIAFHRFPTPDREVPKSKAELASLLDVLGSALGDGKVTLVHCRQGIGRSALVVAAVLMRQGKFSVNEAWATVEKARGRSVPDTDQQRTWLERI